MQFFLGSPSSEDFDLTLLVCLLRNLSNIKIKDDLPYIYSDIDGAALTTIKHYRNRLMHSDAGILADLEFNEWWDKTSQVRIVSVCILSLDIIY